jgi:hypothetical protein
MKLSSPGTVLGVTLAAYIVCGVLLTPVAGFETRDPAKVTTLGIATLVLFFVGLALSVIALVALFRGSARSSMFAIAGVVLYVPVFLAEETSQFSSLTPPTAIARIEILEAVIAVIALAVSFWVFRRGSAASPGS